MSTQLTWPLIKFRLREAILVLPHFLRHPIAGMRTLPDWPWFEILALQAIFASACAASGNAIAHHYIGIAVGLILGPIVNVVVYGITAGFFYYVIRFFYGQPADYRAVYVNVAFAAIPTMLLNIVAPLFPAALPVGIAVTLFLLYIGLVFNFSLARASVRNLLIGLMLLYGMFWGYAFIGTTQHRERLRERATPESLDILEQELAPVPAPVSPSEE